MFLTDPPIDRLAEIYPATYPGRAPARLSVAERAKEFLDVRTLRRAIAEVDGDRLCLLDVGGGAGSMASVAQRADPRVQQTTVVDLDPSCEALAVGRGHRYVCSAVEEFAAEEPFDVILLYGLLECVADPRGLLRRLRGLLSTAGVLVVQTPNHDSLDARLFQHRSWSGLHCPRHWVLYDRASLRLAAQAAGLTPTAVRYVPGAPFWGANLSVEARGPATDAAHPVHRRLSYKVASAAGGVLDVVRAPFAPTSQMVAFLRPKGP